MSVQRRVLLWFALISAQIALLLAIANPWSAFKEWEMLLCTAALLFLVAFTFARKDARGGTTLPLILWFGLAGGLGLRALAYLANTAPSAGLGFDLFAGQAVLQGLNPYAYSAEALLGGGLRVGEAALERSRDLVAGSPQLTQWLTQVTPAETKVNTALLTLPFLALSQVLTPGSPQAWYGILLASDACTLALLFLLLRRLRRPLGWALLFWVNPIWLFAVFLPGAAMALLGPLLLLAVWASISERSALAGFLLALAAAFNVWLAALLALFLRSAGRRPSAWRRAAYGLVGFILISALLWSLHLAFGAQGHWFGGLTAAPVSGIDPLGYLLPQDGSSGWVAGFARLVPSLFLVALVIAGGLAAWPPLPDQGQRAIRAGFLGFFALVLAGSLQPQALLAVIILLPLARSPTLVLASGFGLLVAGLSGLNIGIAGLSPDLTARLGLVGVVGLVFCVAWLSSIRRNQALEQMNRI